MFRHLQDYQNENVEREMTRTVEACLAVGLTANDMQRLLAVCFRQVLLDRAESGYKDIMGT